MSPDFLSLPANPPQPVSASALGKATTTIAFIMDPHAAPASAVSMKQLTHKPSAYNEIQTSGLPVTVSGASVLLPRWINLAAKLFSSNEVPFTTGASSKGFTD